MGITAWIVAGRPATSALAARHACYAMKPGHELAEGSGSAGPIGARPTAHDGRRGRRLAGRSRCHLGVRRDRLAALAQPADRGRRADRRGAHSAWCCPGG